MHCGKTHGYLFTWLVLKARQVSHKGLCQGWSRETCNTSVVMVVKAGCDCSRLTSFTFTMVLHCRVPGIHLRHLRKRTRTNILYSKAQNSKLAAPDNPSFDRLQATPEQKTPPNGPRKEKASDFTEGVMADSQDNVHIRRNDTQRGAKARTLLRAGRTSTQRCVRRLRRSPRETT